MKRRKLRAEAHGRRRGRCEREVGSLLGQVELGGTEQYQNLWPLSVPLIADLRE